MTKEPYHIVIAGGGVAAVESLLAVRDLAGDRVRITLVAPQPDFVLRPLSVAVPFSAGHVRRHALVDLAARTDATLVVDEMTAVDPERHAVRLGDGSSLGYDALVVAVGAGRRVAYPRALTFTGDGSSVLFNGLLADLEEHWTRSVAFVVPPGTTWPLPLYELALMTAREVAGMGIDDLRLELITPESAPLAVFGDRASQAVAALLDESAITFRGERLARAGANGRLLLDPGGQPLDAERVVSLPIMEGPQAAGLPADDQGFIPIDDRGRVRDVADVFAAGDGTTFPIKQGGLACQLADAIAEQLAAAAGADIEPRPFRPVLRGRLLTGRSTAARLTDAPRPEDAEGPGAVQLWSAAGKVEGRYLSPWLAELDGDTSPPAATEPDGIDVEVDVAVAPA